MAFRGPTNARADSSRDARKNFFCDLCGKGYARMPEYDNHIASYDHQHRKRMKEMRELTRDPNAAAKAKAAEQRANRESGLQTISLGQSSSAPKKKPVFKSITQTQSTDAVPATQTAKSLMLGEKLNPEDVTTATSENDPNAAVRNGWYSERYDPMVISECDAACPHCHGRSAAIHL